MQSTPPDEDKTGADKPADPMGLFLQAAQADEAQCLGDRLEALDEEVERNPESHEARLARGLILVEMEDIDGALDDFIEAVRLDPECESSYLWQGHALQQLGRVEEAIAVYSELIRRRPACAQAYRDRGTAQYNQRNFPAAVRDYSESIRLAPDAPETYDFRGMARCHLGDYAQSVADYTRALAHRPDDARLLELRGDAHSNQDDMPAAITDYTQSIRLAPEGRVYRYRGRCHYDLGDHEAAAADFSEAIRLDPGDADAWLRRGWIRLKEGDEAQAIEDFTEAIRLAPDTGEARRGRARVWIDIDEPEKAMADLTEALRIDPADVKALQLRARLHESAGAFDEADADADAAERLQSRDEPNMPESRTLAHALLVSHFQTIPLDALVVTERRFPNRVRADLQRAIDGIAERMSVLHFSGVHKQYRREGVEFAELLVRDKNDPALAVAPQYEEIDIGEEQPLRCLKSGLWLMDHAGSRFAVLLEPASGYGRCGGMRFQVATVNDTNGTQITQGIFRHFEEAVEEARSYRGKILSLESDGAYHGTSTGIKVHRLRAVPRDQVILPPATLELLERNVLDFVRRRPQLAKLGLATRKGLLFYGPPGTGKTHTIHYLAGALGQTTTLIITAEQVALLEEYMTLARLLQPSMVVIEDADLIARDRAHMSGPCEEALLNKLLNEMDGLRESADILFVLTTNRPETLEAALASRPGRIDQAIEFPYPDDEGRRKLVRLYAPSGPLSDEVVAVVVRKTEGVSAAFIKELMRRAAQFQLEREGATEIIAADIDHALEEMLFSGGTLNRKLLGGRVDEPAR